VAAGAARLPDLATLHTALIQRQSLVERYVDAYRRYCWPTQGLAGLKLAPFHLLASEGRVHTDKTHEWHMQSLARLVASDPELLVATPFRMLDPASPADVAAATDWWRALTEKGGEGMVVKPLDFLPRNEKGLMQPALKCRGREYLRIIYGPEYDVPANLARLRHRGLSAKRSLAIRELCLGIEALTRFVNREPLRRVHECVFGVLALESEPVDPRL
jgi:protein phosphatase